MTWHYLFQLSRYTSRPGITAHTFPLTPQLEVSIHVCAERTQTLHAYALTAAEPVIRGNSQYIPNTLHIINAFNQTAPYGLGTLSSISQRRALRRAEAKPGSESGHSAPECVLPMPPPPRQNQDPDLKSVSRDCAGRGSKRSRYLQNKVTKAKNKRHRM